MKPQSRTLLVLALALPPLFAQESAPDAAPQMPSPKTAEHDALLPLAGNWTTHSKMAAMPGVPGMEEASEWNGFETAELVCNGLWLKVTGDNKCKDKSCSGIWMLGYDPFAKRYKCVFASDTDDAPGVVDAVRDAAKNTWTFTGDSPMGKFKSVFVVSDKDTTVETIYSITDDGTEHEVMRTERKRHSGAVPKPASATKGAGLPADAPAALAALVQDCGTWDAQMKMVMPGAPTMESKCKEVVRPICGGKWTWTDYTGTVMGMPFEGHALTGWDATKQRVVSYWVDSMSAPLMQTEGVYDAAKRSFALKGSCYDEGGQVVPVTQVVKCPSDTERELRMTFGEGEGQHVMTIQYTRVGK
ncbi:MAG: DUF1579 family protein [Planctomycetes bacterium]|nr:DUF1579 family protein [Planctomycetota bacterium]MCB9885812.1 DUF1579 family protein [Planctomycetota bacterium]